MHGQSFYPNMFGSFQTFFNCALKQTKLYCVRYKLDCLIQFVKGGINFFFYILFAISVIVAKEPFNNRRFTALDFLPL